jgi:hypothetical protein
MIDLKTERALDFNGYKINQKEDIVKKFRVFIVLFIGLLFVGFTALAQENPMKKKGRSYEIPTQQPSFSLAQTDQNQVNEQAKTQEATTATTTEAKEKETEEPEEQKTIVFALAPILELDIFGLRFSLVIEPIGYGYPYYYRPWYYGWWPGSYFYGYRNWWWNAWEWNRQGWYGSHDRNRERTNPIHASQLRDPRRITPQSAEQMLVAQSNTKPTPVQPQQANVKSYPSRKSLTRNAQQKFNGRISSAYAEPKQSPLLRKTSSSSTRTAINSRQFYSGTRNTRTSPYRVSNQSRPASSRTSLRSNPYRAGSSRISFARSSATRSPVRSSAPRSTAVRSSGASRPSAARTSAPRSASSSRGGSVRRK